KLNTEMGFVIDNADIAQQIAQAFEDGLKATAYRVRLTKEGELEWVEQQGEEIVVHQTEPGTTFGQRLLIRVLSVLPIEWML
ncbi:MAG: phospholipase D family protein, partial [Burkholderiales bacterium]